MFFQVVSLRLGITGSREGMNRIQKQNFKKFIAPYNILNADVGGCVGVDHEATNILLKEFKDNITMHYHMPTDKSLTFKPQLRKHDIVYPDKGYFARNRDIVNACQCLVGIPNTNTRVKSGTWYTINYARQQDKTHVILYLDGRVEKHSSGLKGMV